MHSHPLTGCGWHGVARRYHAHASQLVNASKSHAGARATANLFSSVWGGTNAPTE
jgi:hypothetical protein